MDEFLVHSSLFPFFDIKLLSDNHIGDYPPELKENAIWPSTPAKEAVHQLMRANIIYIHPDGFDYWSDILLELQQHKPLPVKLFIIADSDFAMGNEHIDVMTIFFPNSFFWIQNWYGYHEKVVCLPLGVNKSYKKELQKTKPLGISFLLNYIGNPKREDFFNFLNNTPSILPYCLEKGNFQHYLNQLSECRFSTCPMGEGFDTFRFWESLMVGAIPIVKKHPFYESLRYNYPGIPFVEVEDWSDLVNLLPSLTEDFYQSLMKPANLFMLEQSYWIKQVQLFQNAENK